MQRVISFACHGHRGLGIEYLCPRLHMRDHLHVDTRGIHVLKPDLAEVIKLLRGRVGRDPPRPAVAVAQFGNPEVFLDSHHSFRGQHRLPL